MTIHCCLSQISETALILSHFNISSPQGCVPFCHGSETEISYLLTLVPNPPTGALLPCPACISLCHYSASIFCLVLPCTLSLGLLWSLPSWRKRSAGVDEGQDFSQQGYFLEFTTSSELDFCPQKVKSFSYDHGIKCIWEMVLRVTSAVSSFPHPYWFCAFQAWPGKT